MGVHNLQSLAGVVLTISICWLVSENRRRFPLRLLIGALAIQIVIVLLLFGLPPARAVLDGVGRAVDGLAASTQAGTAFVFGYLAGGPQPFPPPPSGEPYLFAFRVLPVILVVCALSALLWHWGVLKWLTRGFGVVFEKSLGLRGPPALATAATIFMGQVEGPIFIRSYLPHLSRSELFTLMAVGLACVSGSTMVAYATLLQATLPNAAAHVLAASIISAPAGVALARIMVPPAEAETAQAVDLGDERRYDSSIDAVIRGAGDGLSVVLNVAAALIVFVALVTMVDRLLALLPAVGGAPLSLQRGLAIVFTPLAWAIGVPAEEAHRGGLLLGTKLVLTEFTAFIDLGATPVSEFSQRSRTIMTYALCGFANVASVGITTAGFGVLAPERRSEVLSLAWKALLAGFLATCLTASIIGAMPESLFGR